MGVLCFRLPGEIRWLGWAQSAIRETLTRAMPKMHDMLYSVASKAIPDIWLSSLNSSNVVIFAHFSSELKLFST